MNPIIEEIKTELDALIEVINAFEKYEHPAARMIERGTSQLSGSTGSIKSNQPADFQMSNGSPAPVKMRQVSVPDAGVQSGPSASHLSPKSAIGETLNQELLTMFSASSISPATGRLRLPKKEARAKPGLTSNQARYVKIHLIASYVKSEQVYRGKVTFMTYTVDNSRSEERAIDTHESDDEMNGSDSPDFKPKVTHTKGKVHVMRDDLKSPKLDQMKEALAEHGSRIKCRLEQNYNFNLYDWRSDTHSIEESEQAEPVAYEKILMYKKTLDASGEEETDSWESDGDFLSDLIN